MRDCSKQGYMSLCKLPAQNSWLFFFLPSAGCHPLKLVACFILTMVDWLSWQVQIPWLGAKLLCYTPPPPPPFPKPKKERKNEVVEFWALKASDGNFLNSVYILNSTHPYHSILCEDLGRSARPNIMRGEGVVWRWVGGGGGRARGGEGESGCKWNVAEQWVANALWSVFTGYLNLVCVCVCVCVCDCVCVSACVCVCVCAPVCMYVSQSV